MGNSRKKQTLHSAVDQLVKEGKHELGLIKKQLGIKWNPRFTPKKRRILKIALVIFIIGMLPFDMFVYEPRHIELNTYYVPVQNLPQGLDGLRVVQMSDLHLGSTTPNDIISKAVDMANSARPDIVALTGDFVTYHESASVPLSKILSRLHPRIVTYAVLGNHDYDVGKKIVTDALNKCGIQVLVNRSMQPVRGLYIVGMDDPHGGKPDAVAAFRGIDENKCYIMLAHTPEQVYRLKGRHGLLLTGHTHGGQVRLPWMSGRMVPGYVNGRYIAGWYLDGDLRTYVNRGIGMTNAPIRFRCRPEVTVFVLDAVR
ncbi:MAG: metallophosphoesterase [Armatimonadota bacterium]